MFRNQTADNIRTRRVVSFHFVPLVQLQHEFGDVVGLVLALRAFGGFEFQGEVVLGGGVDVQLDRGVRYCGVSQQEK